MSDRDDFAATLAAVPYPPVTPRDVTLAAAKYGWFPDPPWFVASSAVGGRDNSAASR